eukprot:CAMPEP_0170196778 /NCGR_PEP_ID=MMETSP0040_2-20121228/64746_1 /TAXON_ID=641309 /ORGANISM="Lotharella oceanica, Strain CCMP622" /LENGTH=102 /DNA_ID=CAMNT_0010446301 /DNA_START=155 /DNA_END=464 /DNA_ORIENTATION=+
MSLTFRFWGAVPNCARAMSTTDFSKKENIRRQGRFVPEARLSATTLDWCSYVTLHVPPVRVELADYSRCTESDLQAVDGMAHVGLAIGDVSIEETPSHRGSG